MPIGNDYRIYALAVDNADNDAFHNTNLSVWPENRAFTVVSPDTQLPAIAYTIPAANNISFQSNASFSGTATDTGGSGFDEVQVFIRDRSNNQWFNFATNSFSATRTFGTANLNATTISTTNWSTSATLPPGNYALFVNAIDIAGNVSSTNGRFFSVIPNDTQLPVIAYTVPASNNISFQSNAGFSGTATDAGGSGFDEVQVYIRDRSNNQWFNFSSNSFSTTRTFRIANLSATTTSSTNWCTSATLPIGNYTLFVNAIDNAGNVSSTNGRFFSVAPNDTQSPVIAYTVPAVNNIPFQSNAAFAGTATDTGGSGFDQVQVYVRDRSNNQWFNFSTNSFFVTRTFGTANLTATTNSATNWNTSATLPVGNYALFVNAIDNDGNVSSTNGRFFSVIPNDNQLPSIAYTVPTSNNMSFQSNASFSGTATDTGGSGFDEVQVYIRDRSNNQWFNFTTNSFSTARSLSTANLTATTNSSTNWNASATLPTGNYTLFVNAIEMPVTYPAQTDDSSLSTNNYGRRPIPDTKDIGLRISLALWLTTVH